MSAGSSSEHSDEYDSEGYSYGYSYGSGSYTARSRVSAPPPKAAAGAAAGAGGAQASQPNPNPNPRANPNPKPEAKAGPKQQPGGKQGEGSSGASDYSDYSDYEYDEYDEYYSDESEEGGKAKPAAAAAANGQGRRGSAAREVMKGQRGPTPHKADKDDKHDKHDKDKAEESGSEGSYYSDYSDQYSYYSYSSGTASNKHTPRKADKGRPEGGERAGPSAGGSQRRAVRDKASSHSGHSSEGSHHGGRGGGGGDSDSGSVGSGQKTRQLMRRASMAPAGSDVLRSLNEKTSQILNRGQSRTTLGSMFRSTSRDTMSSGVYSSRLSNKDTMAKRRWREAVETLLEQRATQKQSAQVAWAQLITMARQGGLTQFRSLPAMWFFWSVIDFVACVAFVALPDTRSSEGVSTLEEGYDLQFACAIGQVVLNGAIAMWLFFRVSVDRFLQGTNVITLYLVKVFVGLLYIGNLSWPTLARLLFMYPLLISALLQLLLVLRILWKHQVGAALNSTTEQMPQVLRALLDLRKFSNSEEPLTVSMLESLIRWLRVNHKHSGRLRVVNRRHMYTLATLATLLVALMGCYGIGVSYTRGSGFLPKDALDRVVAESNPISSSFIDTEYAFPFADVEHRKLQLVVMTGVRYGTFKKVIGNVLSDTQRSSGTLLRMRAQFPSFSAPNWLTILSGAPPQTTQVMGDVVTDTVKHDTLLTMARRFNLTTAAVTSPRLTAFAKSGLEPFDGDATYGEDYATDETTQHSSALFDQVRLATTQFLVGQQEEARDLVVTHLVNANNMALREGVGPQYESAVTDQVIGLKALMEAVDANTVVVAVSDHGQESPGGYGGVSDQVLDVPLWVYQPGVVSSIADEQDVDSVDLAATCAGMLGIPVPRHSHGTYMAPLRASPFVTLETAHWHDLAYQRAVLSSYLAQLIEGTTSFRDTVKEGLALATTANTAEGYQGFVDALTRDMTNKQDHYALTTTNRNIVVGVLVSVLVVTLFGFLVMVDTYADPTLVFSRRMFTQPREYWISSNVKAFYSQLVLIVLYFALSYAIVALYYLDDGYDEVDMSVVFSVAALGRYLLLVLLPPIGVYFLLHRLIVLRFYRMEKLTFAERQHYKWLHFAIKGTRYLLMPVKFYNLPMAYLNRVYALFMAVIAVALFISLQSLHLFLVPWFYEATFVTDEMWKVQFWKFTCGLLCIPLMAMTMLSTWLWERQELDSESFAAYTELRMSKENRMRELLREYLDVQERLEARRGSKWDSIMDKTRIITPEMFDEQQNVIAENVAERELYLKQIEEIVVHTKELREELAKNQEELAKRLRSAEGEYRKTEGSMVRRRTEQSLEMGEKPAEESEGEGSNEPLEEFDMDEELDEQQMAALEQEVQAEIDNQMQEAHLEAMGAQMNVNREGLGKLKKLLGTDAPVVGNRKASLDENMASKQTAFKHGIEELHAETDSMRQQLVSYEKVLKEEKEKADAKLENQKRILQGVVEKNEKLKLTLEQMLSDREELVETQLGLKLQRRQVLDSSNQEMFSMDSKTAKFNKELEDLESETNRVEKEKQVQFDRVKKVAAELNKGEADLQTLREKVVGFREMISEFVD